MVGARGGWHVSVWMGWRIWVTVCCELDKYHADYKGGMQHGGCSWWMACLCMDGLENLGYSLL